VIPALGLIWRWSRTRVIGVLLLWGLIAFPVLSWRMIETRPAGETILFLALEIGPTILLVALLCMGNATRAIAPWLLLPLFVLIWAATTGLDLLALMVRPDWLFFDALAAWLNALDRMLRYNALVGNALLILVLLLFMALPCVLA